MRGFAPLPRSAKGWRYENNPSQCGGGGGGKEDTDTNGSGGSSSYKSRQQLQQSPLPPVPPPIETIPSLCQARNFNIINARGIQIFLLGFDRGTAPSLQNAQQPMETTPPRTPSWDPNADTYGGGGGTGVFYKESKKRHRSRPNAAPAADENSLYPAQLHPVTNRFIKSATAPHRMLNGSSTVQARLSQLASSLLISIFGEIAKLFNFTTHLLPEFGPP